MKIFIGGSSRDVDSIYYEETGKLAEYLACSGNDLLTGTSCGLIEHIQSLFKKYNRNVIIMEALPYRKETYKYDVLDFATICERKSNLINSADLIVFLPGGIGTLDEIFTTIESKRAKEHNIPIIIININNYYDRLVSLLDNVYKEKFASLEDKKIYYIANNVNDAIKYIEKLGDKVENK